MFRLCACAMGSLSCTLVLWMTTEPVKDNHIFETVWSEGAGGVIFSLKDLFQDVLTIHADLVLSTISNDTTSKRMVYSVGSVGDEETQQLFLAPSVCACGFPAFRFSAAYVSDRSHYSLRYIH